MAAKNPPKHYTFEVTLYNKDVNGQKVVSVIGRSMYVNHRGDLLICNEATTSYGEQKAIACFRSGSWNIAMRKGVAENAEQSE